MELWLFIGALAAVYLLPGPDMILILQTGSQQGHTRALATAVGLAVARGLHVALAALGLATLFASAPWTFDGVRYAGGAYLAWIGLQLLRSPPVTEGIDAVGVGRLDDGHRRAWRRGLLTNLLNPKSLLFCSVLLPQFVSPGEGPVLLQFALLGSLLVGIGLLFDAGYATLGAALQRWFAVSPLRARLQRWTFGSLMIGFALRLAA
ncbi:threonine/homoserine/homoserine lactone efflux protein [Halomonas ventosae]|uniref:Threonine/homoserine/homoserine lactone efflux protein n=1 Tax=Halomonas ventosae TaxID=229007 RepID=A0A4R6ZPG3_9GAMM|nr:LysE family translocator [Halomonas ventosae]TDR54348.1 threonine/homoserine/homoserine lactone efflux protein [Halomonas ventosae]